MFSSQLPITSLIILCRTMRHSLSAGIPIVRVLEQQANRGPAPVRPVAQRIAEQLEQGESLEAALKDEKRRFPPMFISLVTVGEKTGNLPEVLETLEDYFELQQKLSREFYKQIAWPMLEFFITPFVIAAMILLLSLLTTSSSAGFNPMGSGFSGAWGAIRFLLLYFGTFGFFVGLYFLCTKGLGKTQAAHELALKLPALGPCVQAICLTRFCISLRFTMNSGMSIAKAVGLSMRATGNDAYASRAELVKEAIRGGEDLTEALAQAELFPLDLLDVMHSAEEGGRVPEVMEHQYKYYADEARRRMTVLSRVAAWGVSAIVMAMLAYLILSIAMSIYGGGGIIDQNMPK